MPLLLSFAECQFQGGTYALFGLGKSATYPVNYQKTGKTLEARLNELGMVSVLPRGMPWKE